MAVGGVTNWHQLGLYLGLEMSTLDEVDQSYQEISRKKCEMFRRWLRTTPAASWEEIVSALKEMGEKRIAGEVEAKYCGGHHSSRAGVLSSSTCCGRG